MLGFSYFFHSSMGSGLGGGVGNSVITSPKKHLDKRKKLFGKLFFFVLFVFSFCVFQANKRCLATEKDIFEKKCDFQRSCLESTQTKRRPFVCTCLFWFFFELFFI